MSEKEEKKEVKWKPTESKALSIVAKQAREAAMKDTEAAKKKLAEQRNKLAEQRATVKLEQPVHGRPEGVRPLTEEEELAAKEPTRDEKVEARITELCDINTRRGLEAIAREVGFEPTKTEFPDKLSLAKAIAEKEFPEEVLVEEEAEPA